jgi:hypothetical protein
MPVVVEQNPQPFRHSLAVATARADRESIDDIGTMLLGQIAMLQMLGRFLSIDYRVMYESEQAEGWLKLVLYSEGLYQQIHAAVTTAAVLVGAGVSPSLSAPSPGRRTPATTARDRSTSLDASGAHQGDPTSRRSRLCGKSRSGSPRRVRAPACRHTLKPEILRQANDLFTGFHRGYGDPQQAPIASREVVTYLDLFSHRLFDTSPSDFSAARRIVTKARAYDVVVSGPMPQNADTALAALIHMALQHPNRVRANRAGTNRC